MDQVKFVEDSVSKSIKFKSNQSQVKFTGSYKKDRCIRPEVFRKKVFWRRPTILFKKRL